MLDKVQANKYLMSVAKILEKRNAQYYLDSGTLLAAHRDKDFNLYDHDIDIRVLPNQIPNDKTSELVKDLWDIGFRMIMQNRGTRAEIICVTDNDMLLDLKFSFQDDHLIWVYCWNQTHEDKEPRVHAYPRKFFEKMGEIELGDWKYPVPTPIEDYLEYHYGEWRKFKTDLSQANETDLSWDYMYHPPCAMSLAELAEARKNGASSKGAPSAK